MPRGGKRDGAGRRSRLTLPQRLSVGAECERLWRQLTQAEALRRYEAEPQTKHVRQEQDRLQSIPLSARRRARGAVDEVGEEIEDILDGERLLAVKLPQLRCTEQVLEHGVSWCQTNLCTTITKRHVKTCWDEFRKLDRV